MAHFVCGLSFAIYLIAGENLGERILGGSNLVGLCFCCPSSWDLVFFMSHLAQNNMYGYLCFSDLGWGKFLVNLTWTEWYVQRHETLFVSGSSGLLM